MISDLNKLQQEDYDYYYGKQHENMFLCKQEVEREEMGALTIYAM